MSVAQPRSAPTAVDGPGRPEDRPERCRRNPDALALSQPPASGTCRSAPDECDALGDPAFPIADLPFPRAASIVLNLLHVATRVQSVVERLKVGFQSP